MCDTDVDHCKSDNNLLFKPLWKLYDDEEDEDDPVSDTIAELS